MSTPSEKVTSYSPYVPAKYGNLSVSNKSNVLIGDTNDSANWEDIRIPIPPGNWRIAKREEDRVFLVRRD